MNGRIAIPIHPFIESQPTLDGQVLIKFATLPANESLHDRIERQRDAMVCAANWLRMGASGRALEVLEDNLH